MMEKQPLQDLVPPAGMPMPTLHVELNKGGDKDKFAKKGGLATPMSDPTEGPSGVMCHSEMRVGG